MAFSARKISSLKIFLFVAAVFFATALYNIGFIAVDDYHHGISYFIPAQKNTPTSVIAGADFRSPVPNLILLGMSTLGLNLGLESPSAQLRFVNFLLTFFALFGIWILSRIFPKESPEQKLSLLTMGLYFGSPLFLSRPLVEALSAPWLALSLYFLQRYYRDRPQAASITACVLALSVASLFRFQAGICFLAIPIIIFLNGRFKDYIELLLASVAAFIITGLPDYFLKGHFHASLRDYINFNLQHSSMFGTTPFYSYFLLFLGLSIPPTFFAKFTKQEIKDFLCPLVPALLYFLLFLISHSMVPHKEERFMVPIAPIFLLLLVPFLKKFHEERSWRRSYFWTLNALLLPLVCLSTVQNNTVSLALYLNQKTEVKKVIAWEDTLSVFPRAYILRDDFKVESLKANEIIERKEWTCATLLAVRYDKINEVFLAPERFEKIKDFRPGLPEAAVVLLNPGKNARRGPIALYKPKGCAI